MQAAVLWLNDSIRQYVTDRVWRNDVVGLMIADESTRMDDAKTIISNGYPSGY